jgi:hypothetical protein
MVWIPYSQWVHDGTDTMRLMIHTMVCRPYSHWMPGWYGYHKHTVVHDGMDSILTVSVWWYGYHEPTGLWQSMVWIPYSQSVPDGMDTMRLVIHTMVWRPYSQWVPGWYGYHKHIGPHDGMDTILTVSAWWYGYHFHSDCEDSMDTMRLVIPTIVCRPYSQWVSGWYGYHKHTGAHDGMDTIVTVSAWWYVYHEFTGPHNGMDTILTVSAWMVWIPRAQWATLWYG